MVMQGQVRGKNSHAYESTWRHAHAKVRPWTHHTHQAWVHHAHAHVGAWTCVVPRMSMPEQGFCMGVGWHC